MALRDYVALRLASGTGPSELLALFHVEAPWLHTWLEANRPSVAASVAATAAQVGEAARLAADGTSQAAASGAALYEDGTAAAVDFASCDASLMATLAPAVATLSVADLTAVVRLRSDTLLLLINLSGLLVSMRAGSCASC